MSTTVVTTTTDVYDDAYWGFAEMGGTQLCGGAPGADGPAHHPLYERPANQPATPWSGPGRDGGV